MVSCCVISGVSQGFPVLLIGRGTLIVKLVTFSSRCLARVQGLNGSSFFFFFSSPRMVPTTVERLREGQGVRERLLRGIKVERSYKRADGSTEMESGEKSHQTLSS